MKSFGCKISDLDLRDYKIDKSTISSIDKFPDEFKLNYQHVIKNQRSVNSCTAHAVSSILEYYCKNKNIKLSTNFIYGIKNKLYNDRNTGMSIRHACKIVSKYGDPEESYCSGNTEVTKVFNIAEKAFNDESIMHNAYKFKTSCYVNLYNKKDNIKYFIYNYGPAIGSIKWYTNNTIDNNGIFTMNKEDKNAYNLHAVIIYGWTKDGWLCQNSWGTKWGNNGLFLLKYEDGPREAFGLIDDTRVSDLNDIVKPTYNMDILDKVYKIISFIVTKIFIKN